MKSGAFYLQVRRTILSRKNIYIQIIYKKRTNRIYGYSAEPVKLNIAVEMIAEACFNPLQLHEFLNNQNQ